MYARSRGPITSTARPRLFLDAKRRGGQMIDMAGVGLVGNAMSY